MSTVYIPRSRSIAPLIVGILVILIVAGGAIYLTLGGSTCFSGVCTTSSTTSFGTSTAGSTTIATVYTCATTVISTSVVGLNVITTTLPATCYTTTTSYTLITTTQASTTYTQSSGTTIITATCPISGCTTVTTQTGTGTCTILNSPTWCQINISFQQCSLSGGFCFPLNGALYAIFNFNCWQTFCQGYTPFGQGIANGYPGNLAVVSVPAACIVCGPTAGVYYSVCYYTSYTQIPLACTQSPKVTNVTPLNMIVEYDTSGFSVVGGLPVQTIAAGVVIAAVLVIAFIGVLLRNNKNLYKKMKKAF